jgi:hypothetical protein
MKQTTSNLHSGYNELTRRPKVSQRVPLDHGNLNYSWSPYTCGNREGSMRLTNNISSVTNPTAVNAFSKGHFFLDNFDLSNHSQT